MLAQRRPRGRPGPRTTVAITDAPGWQSVSAEIATRDSAQMEAKPLEAIIHCTDGVEHVYTQARDHGVLVTARFLVGTDPDAAATRIDTKIKANIDKIPAGITFITGGQREAIRVVPDAARLAAARVVTTGAPLADADAVGLLTVRSASGAPVLLSHVARVEQGPAQDQARSWRWSRQGGGWSIAPAVPSPSPSAPAPMRSRCRGRWWRGCRPCKAH